MAGGGGGTAGCISSMRKSSEFGDDRRGRDDPSEISWVILSFQEMVQKPFYFFVWLLVRVQRLSRSVIVIEKGKLTVFVLPGNR